VIVIGAILGTVFGAVCGARSENRGVRLTRRDALVGSVPPTQPTLKATVPGHAWTPMYALERKSLGAPVRVTVPPLPV
jgi:hypothetical protein